MDRNCLAQDLVKELFNYVPETGEFTWKVKPALAVQIGDTAGGYTYAGYLNVMVNGKRYMVHRLAWVYMYGDFPKGLSIDHINGTKNDNRISNLRLANQSENLQNRKIGKNNTSGYTGVNWCTRRNKWRARITLNRKEIHIGYFYTQEEAIEAYIKAKVEHHTFNPIQRGH